MIWRIVSGVAVLAAVVAALFAGGRLPAAEPATASGTVISVTPAQQNVACPGELVTPAGGSGSDPELGGAATSITRATYLGGTTRAVGAGIASDAVVGSSVERVGGGDITGLAALTCEAPRTDQWLVGGRTTVGGSARLVLTNPAAVAVEATVTAYGELGELEQRVVALGANSQTEVLLEGVVVEVASLVVHVSANGTGVVAVMQDSRLDGFQPHGTDWVVRSASGESLAVPGVGTGGSEDQSATVRVMSPEGATARLALSTPDGAAVWEGVAALHLEPGVVVEVPVPAVDVGTVTITADAPVVAGASVTRSRAANVGVEGDTAKELRWIPAQPAADANERAVVSVGYTERVVVYAQRPGTFTLTDASGATVASAQLGAGDTKSIPLTVKAGTTLVSNGSFAWTVLVADGDFITALAPTRITVDDVDIEVSQRRYVP